MDIIKSLKNVTNINEYITVTQEVNSKSKGVKIQINLTTVLTLKNIRSLEIEHINKCEENGVACVVLERLLALSPSKTWSVLGKELISLIQYWLEALRKHLMNHSHNWWTFLRKLLKFIKDISLKAPCMPNLLVEHTSECLLDLATAEHPDAVQRQEILHTFNIYCAESGREIRFAMRNKFSDYFVKLSAQMATCGYLPYQYSTLECLIRWLVPRHERSLRKAAAKKWFPLDLYPQNAVEIFLQTNWINFFQDARDFLNAVNHANGLVTSVVCRRLSIGNIHVISGSEKRQSWLDINTKDKSLTVLLDPRVLDRFKSEDIRAWESLHIHKDIMQNVQLHHDSGIYLTINTMKAPSVLPSGLSFGEDNHVIVQVSSRTDLRKMDAALREVFGDKYQALLDLHSQVSISPPRSFNKGKPDVYSEDDTRFSQPIEVKRKRHCGYITRTRNPGGVNTPSSTSTSSLAQLHEKLAALPRFQCKNEPISVCAQPQLSSVIEETEREDRSINTASTVKFRPYGVCQRNFGNYKEKKCQSDSETHKSRAKLSRTLSPVISDDNVSLLFVATFGDSTDQNDTVEHPSGSKNYDNQNTVDLLVQEALQTDKISDSGINTDENKKSQDPENSEAIEGTPVNIIEKPKRNRKVKNKACTVITTTDDESNTEVVNETPEFVNVRNRRHTDVQENEVAQTFEMKTVENFFSQHFTENKRGDIVISPTLARKINNSSPDSEPFNDNYLIMNENFNTDEDLFQFNDIDIIECLNDIVDKVCNDKSTESIREESNMDKTNDIQVEKESNLTSTPKKQLNQNEDKPTKAKKAQPKRANIKIKLKTANKKKTRQVNTKKIKDSESVTNKMSIIVEQTEESVEANEDDEVNKQSPIIKQKLDKNTPINCRKRKLYSPKDDNIEIKSAPKMSDTDDDEILVNFKTKTKPTSSASCYKEIEKERKRYIRSKPRRSGKKIAEPLSPRTVQNNTIFDNLKDNVENTEKITLADKNTAVEVYNVTSESEDEDFKKKIEIKKRVSSTTLTSANSTGSNRRGRPLKRQNYSESKSSNDEANNKKPIVKRRQTKRRTVASKRKAVITDAVEQTNDLVDERMRDTTDVVNTSIVINPPEKEESKNIEPIIQVHEMEPAEIEPPKKTTSKTQKPKKTEIIKVKIEKDTKNKLKLKKNELKVVSDKDEDRTISPLPGLVVEVAPESNQDANDSLTTKMLQKFKNIYHKGPEVNETNSTQNMLSDVERINNNSQQNISLSVTDQIYFATRDETLVIEDKKRSNKAQLHNSIKQKSLEEIGENDVMEIISIPKNHSDVSIATDGITAHGDIEEDPPSPQTIKQNIQNRDIVDLNESMKEYFIKLTRAMNKTSIDYKETTNSDSSQSVQKKKISSKKSPVLVKRRILSIEGMNNTSTDSNEPRNSKTIERILVNNLNKSMSIEKSPVALVKRVSRKEKNKTSIGSKDSRNYDFIESIQQNKLNKSTSSDKSPVVSVKRLSMEDIRRYLPSRRSSETDTSYSQKSEGNETKKITSSNLEKKDSTRKLTKQNTAINLSVSSKSPVASIARISLEEFNKWLPPIPDNDNEPPQSQNKRNSCSLNIDKENFCLKKTERKPKTALLKTTQEEIIQKPLLRSFTKKQASTSQSNTAVSSKALSKNFQEDIKGKRLLRSFTKKFATPSLSGEISHQIPKLTSNAIRKSNISPVKSFEDFAQHLQSNNESDDEYAKTIKSLSKPRSPMKNYSRIVNISQGLRRSKSPMKESRIVDNLQEFASSVKRASSPIRNSGKKPRYEDTVTMESGPSVSSVHDWLKTSQSRIQGPGLIKEAVQNILEKLDTTLAEVNQNTSKKLVKLFVEAQANLDSQKEERRKMYTEMDKRLQSMDNEFKENLKTQAFKLIKEDCKQKRAMVTLLKEDVLAIIDHNNSDSGS